MCTVKPYHICSQKIWIICCKASPGGVYLGSGITFDIFTHVFHGLVFFNFSFINIVTNVKEKIQFEGLDDGYNVSTSEKMIMLQVIISGF